MLRLRAFVVVLSFVSVHAHADLVLTAPPRESAAKAREVFEPIAGYLSSVLQTRVEFRYSDNWLSYQSDMLADKFDIVFDGPHFASWRMAKQKHEPLVKLPGQLSYVVVVRQDETKITDLRKLEGRMLCSPSSPNLGALSVSALFTNPARQPMYVNTGGFKQAYEGLLNKKCAAAVLQAGLYLKLDPEKKQSKPIASTEGLPNQVFTAGPRLSAEQRERLRTALMSEPGKAATRLLRDEYAGKDFVVATTAEFTGHSALLKDTWGFALPEAEPKLALKK